MLIYYCILSGDALQMANYFAVCIVVLFAVVHVVVVSLAAVVICLICLLIASYHVIWLKLSCGVSSASVVVSCLLPLPAPSRPALVLFNFS